MNLDQFRKAVEISRIGNVPAPWQSYVIWQYAVRQDGLAWGMKSHGLDHDQMVESYLPPVPPPPDLAARVTALEARVTALEQR